MNYYLHEMPTYDLNHRQQSNALQWIESEMFSVAHEYIEICAACTLKYCDEIGIPVDTEEFEHQFPRLSETIKDLQKAVEECEKNHGL